MLSKRSFGIAGAAMLGTVALLGTNAANAAIVLGGDALVFAKETVTATVDDAEMYYTVNGADSDNAAAITVDALDIRGLSGVGAAQDESLVVTFTLSGMVFGEALTNSSLTVSSYTAAVIATDGTVTTPEAIGNNELGDGGEVVLRTGGEKEGTSAVFGVSNGNGDIDKTDLIILHVDMLGVSMGGGTVTMMVEHEDGRSQSTSDPGMVQFMTGVVEKGSPMNAMTYVATNYSDFGALDPAVADTPGTTTIDESRDYIDTLGSFTVGSAHLDASDGTSATMADVFGTAAFDSNAEIALAAAKVTMSGDAFSFAETVWLDDAEACDEATPTNLLETDGDITAVALNSLFDSTPDGSESTTNARYLCLGVENDSSTAGTLTGLASIPRTGPYMAMTMYTGAATAMNKPMNGSIGLGRIVRDGTNVHMPYLTTDDRYNQRIIIVNRSMDSVHYQMELGAPEDGGIMAERGTDGIGMLDPNSTTVLHMRRHDVVRMTGTGAMRTSGTLIIEAEPMYISVATNQTNMMTGGTDTVVLHNGEDM